MTDDIPQDATARAVRELAHRHLPAADAQRWLGLMRPGADLTAAGASDPVCGQLGGLPRLPSDVPWPVCEEHGPLSFVASLECAALPLPVEGRLLFFCHAEEPPLPSAGSDPGLGARVLHVPAGTGAGAECAERPAPPEREPFRCVPLTARARPTVPQAESPHVERAFPQREHPVYDQEFRKEVHEHVVMGHQAGGHPTSLQAPVEVEVASAALGGSVAWHDPRLAEEASRWLLLAQFDSDDAAGMMWGDVGILYWLIRPEDLAARRFDAARFTWQCC